MFSKIDKKNLTIVVIFFIIGLLAGFLFVKYLKPENPNIENNSLQTVQFEAEVQNGGGTLTICMDECGNGVCQQPEASCLDEGSISCVCLETPTDCPQDCK